MELDRQTVERRDFPISRRGYDPAAVDAHLRTIAGHVQELLDALEHRSGESLGSTAGAQVQGILEAAEATAGEIERQASDDATRARSDAAADAAQTRADAIARAQAHVNAVSQATAVLLARVESMDSEVDALVQSLRDGAGRLAADLGDVEVNMGELYDAASGAAGAEEGAAGPPPPPAFGPAAPVAQPLSSPAPPVSEPPPSAPPPSAPPPPETAAAEAKHLSNGNEPHAAPAPAAAPTPKRAAAARSAPASEPRQAPSSEPPPAPPSAAGDATPASGGGEDLDGARLVALNMALNGEPREQADRYLAENFELADRAKLLDEVYAAIEG